jgi:hypothetical protein
MISIKSRLDSHFRLAAAAATGAAAVSTTSSANAAVIYSGLQNVPIFPITDNGGVYFDFEAPFTSAQGTRPDGWDVNPYASGASIYLASNTAIVLAGATAADLAFGTPITAASLFSGNGFAGGVAIPAGSTGLFGFRFTSNNAGGPVGTLFGWARVSVATAGNGNVVDWAYENTGASITAGAVPEPSSLGLLAAGAAGLAQWRRRRASV